ncbi:spo0J domain protein [Orientia tsutsugamushi str. UT76]|nr:spo0J domain protein [Orientia tsutsugamushi str. UT76]
MLELLLAMKMLLKSLKPLLSKLKCSTNRKIYQKLTNPNKLNKSNHVIKYSTGLELDELSILTQNLSQKLNTKVFIENSNHGGKITIVFSNLEKLDDILSRIK